MFTEELAHSLAQRGEWILGLATITILFIIALTLSLFYLEYKNIWLGGSIRSYSKFVAVMVIILEIMSIAGPFDGLRLLSIEQSQNSYARAAESSMFLSIQPTEALRFPAFLSNVSPIFAVSIGIFTVCAAFWLLKLAVSRDKNAVRFLYIISASFLSSILLWCVGSLIINYYLLLISVIVFAIIMANSCRISSVKTISWEIIDL